MTGRYGGENGVMSLGGRMKPGERTFPHFPRDAGYRTALIGKHRRSRNPEDPAFERAVYFEPNGPHFDRRVVDGGRTVAEEGYIEDYPARRAAAFVKECRRKDRPNLLFYCTQVPRMNPRFTWPASERSLRLYPASGMPVPESWNDSLEGKPPYLKRSRSRGRGRLHGYDRPEGIQEHYRRYFAAVTDMDPALGRLVEEVEKSPGDTYVLFTSENGWFMGVQGFTSKVLPYEESIRAPMFARGAGDPKTKDGRHGPQPGHGAHDPPDGGARRPGTWTGRAFPGSWRGGGSGPGRASPTRLPCPGLEAGPSPPSGAGVSSQY